MMSIFAFIIWLLVAGAVFAVLFWSVRVAMAQRQGWGAFAAKYKLTLQTGKKYLDPIGMGGVLNGRKLVVYGHAELSEISRTQTTYTYIEVTLSNPMPALCVFSKKPVPEMIRNFLLPNTFSLPAAEWPSPLVSMTDDVYAMANWFTPARLQAFKAFMELSAARGVETLLVNTNDTPILVWRGFDPLSDPRALNALVQKLYSYAAVFDGIENGMSAKPNPSSDTAPAVTPA